MMRLPILARQTWCWLHGHDHLLTLEPDRMFLKCVSCASETPGWELNEAPPIVRYAKLLRFRRRIA